MRYLRNLIEQGFVFCLFSYFIVFSCSYKLCAEEFNWIKVANYHNEIQFIDTNSIKYNNQGLLSVFTKYTEVNPDDQSIVKTKSYLIAIDCDNRLYSKIPLNGQPNQVKKWTNSINDKLIKTTIINSCSY